MKNERITNKVRIQPHKKLCQMSIRQCHQEGRESHSGICLNRHLDSYVINVLLWSSSLSGFVSLSRIDNLGGSDCSGKISLIRRICYTCQSVVRQRSKLAMITNSGTSCLLKLSSTCRTKRTRKFSSYRIPVVP